MGYSSARTNALSSNRLGSRTFKPRDAGATPVKATNLFEQAPALDPRPEPSNPRRISQEPAGGQSRQGNISCVCGVTATCRSAMPEFRVRFSARAPILCAGTHSSDWSRLLIWRAPTLHRGCKSLSAHQFCTSREPANPAACKAVFSTVRHRGRAPFCYLGIWPS